MLAGELYDPLDPELVRLRTRARDLLQTLNGTREADEAGRRELLMALFGAGGESAWIQPPFYCDYGGNIRLGQRVFFNFNCVVHPMDADLRRRQESGKPVAIGSDVWVGGRGRSSAPAAWSPATSPSPSSPPATRAASSARSTSRSRGGPRG